MYTCITLCVSVLMYECKYIYTTSYMWRSGDNFWELVISYHVGSGDQTQVLGLAASDFTH